jgi:CBS-domain-containing membrane protein
MKVREIMTADVLTARPETTVNRIAQLMTVRGVSGIPVIDDARRVVGMVTELDLIVRNTRLEPPAFFPILDGRIPLETPGHYWKRLQHMLGTRAAEVMTESVVTIGPDADLEDLASLMMTKRVNPVPVVADGIPVGVVSRADLIRMMSRELGEPGEVGT